MKVGVGVCAESLVWVGECIACRVKEDRVIQQCNSSKGLKQTMKPKTFSANVSWGEAGKVSLKKRMILSALAAWTIQTKWENECVARRKEKTWRVLQEFNYSWKRGHVHRERNRLFLGGCTPTQLSSVLPSSHSHTIMFYPHPSLLLLIDLCLLQQDSLL